MVHWSSHVTRRPWSMRSGEKWPEFDLWPDHLEENVRTSWSLQLHHNGRDGVSNHQPHDCLLNRLFGCRSKKTSKPRVTGFCAGNSPVTGEFPTQMASNAESVSIWWRHHVVITQAITHMVLTLTHKLLRVIPSAFHDVCHQRAEFSSKPTPSLLCIP